MAKPPVKAQELASVLAAQIRAGEIEAGAWLPSERQLAEIHRVGRSTARQAVQMLADSELVNLAAGSGAQVRGSARVEIHPDDGAADVRGELAAIREQLGEMNARLLAIEIHTGTAHSDS